MSEKQRIPFLFTEFEVTECRVGKADESRSPSAVLRAAMSGFVDWVQQSKSVSDTFIEEAGDLYVKDAAMSGNVSCVVLWKQSGAGTTTYALNINSAPGAGARVKSNDFGAGYIPGDPLYFLVDSARMRLFTLRPPLAVRTCRPDLERAVRFYLLFRSNDAARTLGRNGTTDFVSIGSGNGFSPSDVSFSSRLCRERALVENLTGRIDKVRALVHVIPLKNRPLEEKREKVNPVISFFSRRLAKSDIESVNAVRYEVDMEFGEEDVKDVFDRQAEALLGERFGFKLRGSDDVQWADSEIARESHNLSLASDDGVFSARELLDAAGQFL